MLAKAASGALELVPMVTVQNLARGIAALKERGFLTVGLDSEATEELPTCRCRRRWRSCSERKEKACGN